MSGGYYDYAYHHIELLAEDIKPLNQLRIEFKSHLLKVAKACHDIEWVDSGDYGPGDETDAILACLDTADPEPKETQGSVAKVIRNCIERLPIDGAMKIFVVCSDFEAGVRYAEQEGLSPLQTFVDTSLAKAEDSLRQNLHIGISCRIIKLRDDGSFEYRTALNSPIPEEKV
jgi:hypothetical protein